MPKNIKQKCSLFYVWAIIFYIIVFLFVSRGNRAASISRKLINSIVQLIQSSCFEGDHLTCNILCLLVDLSMLDCYRHVWSLKNTSVFDWWSQGIKSNGSSQVAYIKHDFLSSITSFYFKGFQDCLIHRLDKWCCVVTVRADNVINYYVLEY